jgi:L,D-transpeptidase ErfK/SrfK
MIKKNRFFFIVFLLLAIIIVGYTAIFTSLPTEKIIPENNSIKHSRDYSRDHSIKKIEVGSTITIEKYFSFLDSIVLQYDSLTPYHLTEHLLIRANPWVIDTLRNTDYYIQKARGLFIYDQKKIVVLKKGDHLILPDSVLAKKITASFQKTRIDINIPEFKLRIFEDSLALFKFPIRVGRDERKYLGMARRVQDLKTKTGKGLIVGYNRYPNYYNPVNSHQYFITRRDDNKVTKLPQVPFIETEINGLRYGQLIHPTTNPITLGKAYSNGCIGTEEGDAWVIYYYAPINTKINIRYNLNIKDNSGENVVLRDIYGYVKKK